MRYPCSGTAVSCRRIGGIRSSGTAVLPHKNIHRRWADSIGINTRKVVDAILTSGRVEQQTYRSCMGLLKLAEKHSPSKLEEACSRALLYSRTPSYKSIKNLLAAMKEDSDPVSQNPDSISSETQSQARGITRGARYYGGKRS